MNSKTKKIAIIGGGASGFFSALRLGKLCKESRTPVEITIYEATPHFLKKVSISGGGRCNVTHFEFNSTRFCENYPRGKKELRSPFGKFQARDTVDWFKERGIRLVAEEDGRMFPHTNQSASVIRCFMTEAEKYEINLLKSHNLRAAKKLEDGSFQLNFHNELEVNTDYLILATGSSPTGYRLAKSLGLKISDLAPSLFSFKITSPLLKDLSGTSFPWVDLKLKCEGKVFKQSGPMLITHWGLSGPAILKLSAWAAREMKECAYKAELQICWQSGKNQEQIRTDFLRSLEGKDKNNIGNLVPSEFSKRFWTSFLEHLEIEPAKKVAELSKKDRNKIIENLYCTILAIDGKNRYKDEFVECGGVALKQIQFSSMESKEIPGLYITGELLDIDGITGGFNFQNAWTSGWLSAGSIHEKITN